MAWNLRRSCFGVSIACALSGCSASSFDGHVYKHGELSFRVGPIPPGWRSVDVDGALLAFRDDAAAATVALNGRCGLDGDDVPLEALTHHLFINFTDRKLVRQAPFELAGRAALKSELDATLDGVVMHYVVVVLKKDGCVYDFMLVTPPATTANSAGFDRFVAGFETL
jgi:hypothetical protein